MNQHEILTQLRNQLPEGTLTESEWESIRFAIRSTFEFADFVSHLNSNSVVTPDVEQFMSRIAEGIDKLYETENIARQNVTSTSVDPFEKIEYANETTVAGANLFMGLREIASEIVRDTRPKKMKWRVYPSIVELKEEFFIHLDKLRTDDVIAQDRIIALLHAARLQIVFLANTFC
jgi:hypothetical protein